MHTGRVSGRLADAVPSQADVILYYINSVLQDEPPLEALPAGLRRARALRSPTGDEQ